MGQPVVHFQVLGKDAARLQSYYSGLFGWEINTDNPMNYGTIERDGNVNAEGAGIGGGIGQCPEGQAGGVTFYVEVADVEAALAQAESLGGKRLMGPDAVPGTDIVLGHFEDPEGNGIGLIRSGS